MRLFSRTGLLAAALALGSWRVGVATQDRDRTDQHDDTHRRPGAAVVNNPVSATAESIAAGQKVFKAQCTGCHGSTGKGDGKMAAELNPKPADLTDDSWKHGSTDGEIFAVIRDGSKGTGMKPFGSRLTADDMWNVVNYLRTLSAGDRPLSPISR